MTAHKTLRRTIVASLVILLAAAIACLLLLPGHSALLATGELTFSPEFPWERVGDLTMSNGTARSVSRPEVTGPVTIWRGPHPDEVFISVSGDPPPAQRWWYRLVDGDFSRWVNVGGLEGRVVADADGELRVRVSRTLSVEEAVTRENRNSEPLRRRTR